MARLFAIPALEASLALAAVLVVLAIVFRHEIRRRYPRLVKTVTFGLLVLAVALATALLLQAVLLIDVLEKPVDWLVEDILDLGGADEALKNQGVVGWIRLLFLAGAVALLALVRALGHRIWLDVLAVTTVLLFGYALLDARADTAEIIAKEADPPVKHPPTGRAWLKFPATKLADPLSDYKSGEAATMILVIPRRDVENKTIDRTTSRYDVRLRSDLTPTGNTEPIEIGVSRGEKDAQLARLSRDLEGAERILVFPAGHASTDAATDLKPIAIASATQLARRRSTFRLDARQSHDTDGQIAAYVWRVDSRLAGRRVAFDHSFPIRTRPYRVSLTVTDNDGLSAVDTLMLVRLGGNVLFCFDCRTIGRRGRLLLAALRPVAGTQEFVRIDGHTDSAGELTYNQRLARDRACAVRATLLPLAVSRQRVEVRAFGERLPVTTNDTPLGRSMNRRVEILLDSRALGRGHDRVTPQLVRC